MPSIARELLICWVLSLLCAGPTLAQSHGHLDTMFQPWNGAQRSGEMPGELRTPELRGRALHRNSGRRRAGDPDVSDRIHWTAGRPRPLVDYQTTEPAGTIVIDTQNTVLHLVVGGGKALRYEIGWVGKASLGLAGSG